MTEPKSEALDTIRAALTDCRTQMAFARTEINRLEREGGFIGPRVRQLQATIKELEGETAELRKRELAELRRLCDIERARLAALPKPPIDPIAERHRIQRLNTLREDAAGRLRPRVS